MIDNHGIGYRVFSSESSLRRIRLDQDEKIYTYLHIREDIMDLYGFLTQEELTTFELLISVSGVGPKVGLALLSSLPPSEFALAVVTGNSKTITKAPGVGPKMAQRIILELKDKLKNDSFLGTGVSESFGTEPVEDGNEAVSALIVLGYSPSEAKKAVADAGTTGSTEETVKAALKLLMK